MLAKAFEIGTEPMKWDEKSFNTPFVIKMCKKLYFQDLSIQMYGAIGENTLPFTPVAQAFGLKISHMALSQHPYRKIQKCRLLLFVNIKVKVRSCCVSDRSVTGAHLEGVGGGYIPCPQKKKCL